MNKKFSDNKVIKDLNLVINDGEVTALVGKNGAGKSTLIRIISGLYNYDSGSVIMPQKTKTGVLLGGDVNLYRNLTGYEIIRYYGRLYGLSNKEIGDRIDVLDTVLHYKEFINKPSYTFSRGMKQKIALVISILHDPDILLLDEPSTGLDIESSNDVIEFIKYLKHNNKTILIATHNIFEISDLSDSIAFIREGRIDIKISVKEFFMDCPNDEKSSRLIAAMKGGLCSEEYADNTKERTY